MRRAMQDGKYTRTLALVIKLVPIIRVTMRIRRAVIVFLKPLLCDDFLRMV